MSIANELIAKRQKLTAEVEQLLREEEQFTKEQRQLKQELKNTIPLTANIGLYKKDKGKDSFLRQYCNVSFLGLDKETSWLMYLPIGNIHTGGCYHLISLKDSALSKKDETNFIVHSPCGSEFLLTFSPTKDMRFTFSDYLPSEYYTVERYNKEFGEISWINDPYSVDVNTLFANKNCLKVTASSFEEAREKAVKAGLKIRGKQRLVKIEHSNGEVQCRTFNAPFVGHYGFGERPLGYFSTSREDAVLQARLGWIQWTAENIEAADEAAHHFGISVSRFLGELGEGKITFFAKRDNWHDMKMIRFEQEDFKEREEYKIYKDWLLGK